MHCASLRSYRRHIDDLARVFYRVKLAYIVKEWSGCISRVDVDLFDRNHQRNGKRAAMDKLSMDEWDLLIYIASYRAGYGRLPTRQKVVQAGVDQAVVEQLLALGLLTEIEGQLQPSLEESYSLYTDL
jgi:hypothetical protein